MVTIDTTRLPESECPQCHKRLDAASGVVGAKPTPGALSVCAACGVLLIFTEELTVRLLTKEDARKLPKEHLALILRMQRTLKQVIAERN